MSKLTEEQKDIASNAIRKVLEKAFNIAVELGCQIDENDLYKAYEDLDNEEVHIQIERLLTEYDFDTSLTFVVDAIKSAFKQNFGVEIV